MRINSGELMEILTKLYRDYKICRWIPYVDDKRIDEVKRLEIGFINSDERDKYLHGWHTVSNSELAKYVTKFTTSIGKPDLFIDGNFIESPLYYLVIEITESNMAIYYNKFDHNNPTSDTIKDPDKQLLGSISKFDHASSNGTITTITSNDFFEKILVTNKDVFYKKELEIRMDNYDVKSDEVDIYNQLIPKIDKYLCLK